LHQPAAREQLSRICKYRGEPFADLAGIAIDRVPSAAQYHLRYYHCIGALLFNFASTRDDLYSLTPGGAINIGMAFAIETGPCRKSRGGKTLSHE